MIVLTLPVRTQQALPRDAEVNAEFRVMVNRRYLCRMPEHSSRRQADDYNRQER